MPAIFPDFEIKIISASGEERYVTALANLDVELCSDAPSDKARFTVPSKDDKDLQLFKEEDKVEISLGYKKGDNIPGLAKVFTGEITSISRELPLVVTAHDPFYRAKKEHVTWTYGTDSTPLYYTDIARDLLSKVGLSAVIPSEQDNGPGEKQHSVEFHDKTIAEAMEIICERTQWTQFFIPGSGDQVYFGPRWPYHRNYLESMSDETYVFIVGKEGSAALQDRGNVISCDGLEYLREKPYKEVTCQLYDTTQRFLSVSGKATAEGETGSSSAKIKLPYSFVGEDEASARKSAESYAQRCAEEHLDMLNSREIGGFLTALGNPNLSHSHEIGVVWRGDKELSRHNGYYDAKRVMFTYSPRDGFRMHVHISKPPLSKNTKEL